MNNHSAWWWCLNLPKRRHASGRTRGTRLWVGSCHRGGRVNSHTADRVGSSFIPGKLGNRFGVLYSFRHSLRPGVRVRLLCNRKPSKPIREFSARRRFGADLCTFRRGCRSEGLYRSWVHPVLRTVVVALWVRERGGRLGRRRSFRPCRGPSCDFVGHRQRGERRPPPAWRGSDRWRC